MSSGGDQLPVFRCMDCHETFESKNKLKKHIRTHSERQSWKLKGRRDKTVDQENNRDATLANHYESALRASMAQGYGESLSTSLNALLPLGDMRVNHYDAQSGASPYPYPAFPYGLGYPPVSSPLFDPYWMSWMSSLNPYLSHYAMCVSASPNLVSDGHKVMSETKSSAKTENDNGCTESGCSSEIHRSNEKSEEENMVNGKMEEEGVFVKTNDCDEVPSAAEESRPSESDKFNGVGHQVSGTPMTCSFCEKVFYNRVELHQHERYLCESALEAQRQFKGEGCGTSNGSFSALQDAPSEKSLFAYKEGFSFVIGSGHGKLDGNLDDTSSPDNSFFTHPQATFQRRQSTPDSAKEEKVDDNFECCYCNEVFSSAIEHHQHERYLCQRNHGIQASSLAHINHVSNDTPQPSALNCQISEDKISILRDLFAKNSYPNVYELHRISHMLSLSKKSVQIYFQRMRAHTRPNVSKLASSANHTDGNFNSLLKLGSPSKKPYSRPSKSLSSFSKINSLKKVCQKINSRKPADDSKILQEFFRSNPEPSYTEIGKIADIIGCSKQVVEIWFQTMRSRIKQEHGFVGEISQTTSQALPRSSTSTPNISNEILSETVSTNSNRSSPAKVSRPNEIATTIVVEDEPRDITHSKPSATPSVILIAPVVVVPSSQHPLTSPVASASSSKDGAGNISLGTEDSFVGPNSWDIYDEIKGTPSNSKLKSSTPKSVDSSGTVAYSPNNSKSIASYISTPRSPQCRVSTSFTDSKNIPLSVLRVAGDNKHSAAVLNEESQQNGFGYNPKDNAAPESQIHTQNNLSPYESKPVLLTSHDYTYLHNPSLSSHSPMAFCASDINSLNSYSALLAVSEASMTSLNSGYGYTFPYQHPGMPYHSNDESSPLQVAPLDLSLK